MNKIIVNYKQQIIIILLFITALIFRLINLNFSFSNDELSAIIRCNQVNFSDLISNGVLVDFHPAGVQTFMYYWIKLFGNSEFAVRLPFAIFSSIAVVFSFLYTKRKFGFTPALLTSISLIVLEFPLLYGQIARPYSSGLMLSMILIYIWDKVVFPKGDEENYITKNLILLSFIFAANAYNHYFSSLFAAIVFTSGLFVISKNNILKYIFSGLFAFILFLPHIGITLHHMSIGGIGSWLGKPESNFLYLHILHIFNDSLALTLLILNAILLYLIINKTASYGNWRKRLFALLLFLLPFTIGYFYSIFRNPVLQNRVLIFSMPFFLIFIFSFFKEGKNIKEKAIIWFIPFVMLFYTLFISKYYSTKHFIDFKGIANSCLTNHNKYKNNELLSLQHCNSTKYLQYYMKDTSINFKINEISNENQLWRLKNILNSNSEKEVLEYITTKPQNRISTMMISSIYEGYNKDNTKLYLHGYHLYRKTNGLIKHIDSNDCTIFKNYSKDTIRLKNSEYSKGIEYFTNDKSKCILRVSFMFEVEFSNTESMIVFSKQNSFDKDDKEWWSIPLKYFVNSQWNNVNFDVPFNMNRNDNVKIYIWNPKKEDIKLKDYKLGISVL